MTTTVSEPSQNDMTWHAATVDEVARRLTVDPAKGLSAAEVKERAARYGANELAAKKKEIKKVPLPGGLKPAQEILSLSSPVRSKQTQMIGGTPADAAKELVRRLREEARVL